MDLSTAELLCGSVGTGLVGGTVTLLGSKLTFLKEDRWRGPRVMVCLATTVSVTLAWSMELLESILLSRQGQDRSRPIPSTLSIAAGLMILVFGLMGTLKRLAAWSRIDRSNDHGVKSSVWRLSAVSIAWILIGLAMVESLVFLFVSVITDRPLSLILVGALFGLTLLSDLVVWFSLILNGQRIGSRSSTAILELINTCMLVTYLGLHAIQDISVRPMYVIYMSCGLLGLIVIVECGHPGAFPDLSKNVVLLNSSSIRQTEKDTQPRRYLSVRFDSNNLAEFASEIIKEVELGIRDSKIENGAGGSSLSGAFYKDSSTSQDYHSYDSGRSRLGRPRSQFADLPAVQPSQQSTSHRLRDPILGMEIGQSATSIYSHPSVRTEINQSTSDTDQSTGLAF